MSSNVEIVFLRINNCACLVYLELDNTKLLCGLLYLKSFETFNFFNVI